MFFLFISFVCGIVLGQEMDSLPRLKPHFVELYEKLFVKDSGDSSE